MADGVSLGGRPVSREDGGGLLTTVRGMEAQGIINVNHNLNLSPTPELQSILKMFGLANVNEQPESFLKSIANPSVKVINVQQGN